MESRFGIWMTLAVAMIGVSLLGSLVAQRPSLDNPPQKSVSNPSPAAFQHTPPESRAATPRVRTGETDLFGRPVTISCASCHANFEPNTQVESGDTLREFHQGLSFVHGKLTCVACHNPENYNQLRLAGGQPLEFAQVQMLCRQCHSKQGMDFEHGVHGGMNGYWDLTRGNQVRKICIDCHDPHSPAFPAMVPTFKPHDRFLEKSAARHEAPVHE